jgi:hypothetical protein
MPMGFEEQLHTTQLCTHRAFAEKGISRLIFGFYKDFLENTMEARLDKVMDTLAASKRLFALSKKRISSYLEEITVFLKYFAKDETIMNNAYLRLGEIVQKHWDPTLGLAVRDTLLRPAFERFRQSLGNPTLIECSVKFIRDLLIVEHNGAPAMCFISPENENEVYGFIIGTPQFLEAIIRQEHLHHPLGPPANDLMFVLIRHTRNFRNRRYGPLERLQFAARSVAFRWS